MKKYFLLFFTIQMPVICFAQDKIDVVYLKSGNIIKGTILEINIGNNIKIETREGNIFIYTMDEIIKIEKVIDENKKLAEMNKLNEELKHYTARKNSDFIFLLFTYGVTIAGDYSVDSEVFSDTYIPVVGPFLSLDDFGNYPNADTHKALMIISGVIQSVLFIDMIYSNKQFFSIRNKINIAFIPSNKTMFVSYAINF